MGKRIADLVITLVLLLPALVLTTIAAVASALTYRAWPFFVQPRVGREGRTFRLLKVRTLDPATPAAIDKYHLEEHRPGRVGHFLRAHHLDELPQLVNVLTGRMSLVGPRPEMPALHAELPPDFAALRTSVRPGVTGLWQVSRAVEGLIGEAPEFDEYYVAARSGRLDAWILWRTTTRLLGRSPLESLEDLPAQVRRPAGAQLPATSAR